MKCPTCGANLQIEDEKCPFCGNPNPYARKHRQEMQYYHQEFQKTKQEVEKKTRHYNSFTVRITAAAVLLVLILGMAYIGRDGAYYIWYGQVKRQIAAHAGEHAQNLGAYEQDGDWMRLYAYYDANNLSYTNDFHEYRILYYTIFDYKCILNDITRYRTGDSYYTAEEVSSRIAEYLDSFYQSVERVTYEAEYYDDNYSPGHKEAYARIREDMEAVLSAYCHLTKEELKALPDYSVAKKSSLLEEGLLRETDRGEAAAE